MTTGDYPDGPISKKKLLNDLNNIIHAWSDNKFRGSANIPLKVLLRIRQDIRNGEYDFSEPEAVGLAKNTVIGALLKGNDRLRESLENAFGREKKNG